jgi:hypothetical protein
VVSDPRAKRGIRHKIASTLAMVAAAGLAGCGRSFRSVGDFVADLPQEALARLGARWHPARCRKNSPTSQPVTIALPGTGLRLTTTPAPALFGA